MMEEECVPIGFRFCPTEEEAIDYLRIKDNGSVLPSHAFKEYNVYACNPDQLPRDFNHGVRNELYFFTTRGREYLKGRQPFRIAGDGFWVSTRIEEEIHGSDNSIIGYKKTFVFYYKENKKKSNWVMNEYRVPRTDGSTGQESSKVDGFVICRTYERETEAP